MRFCKKIMSIMENTDLFSPRLNPQDENNKFSNTPFSPLTPRINKRFSTRSSIASSTRKSTRSTSSSDNSLVIRETRSSTLKRSSSYSSTQNNSKPRTTRSRSDSKGQFPI